MQKMHQRKQLKLELQLKLWKSIRSLTLKMTLRNSIAFKCLVNERMSKKIARNKGLKAFHSLSKHPFQNLKVKINKRVLDLVYLISSCSRLCPNNQIFRLFKIVIHMLQPLLKLPINNHLHLVKNQHKIHFKCSEDSQKHQISYFLNSSQNLSILEHLLKKKVLSILEHKKHLALL